MTEDSKLGGTFQGATCDIHVPILDPSTKWQCHRGHKENLRKWSQNCRNMHFKRVTFKEELDYRMPTFTD